MGITIAWVVLGLVLGGLVAWLVAHARNARLEEQLRSEREATAEKLAILDDAQKRLSDHFQALASEALQRNNESFAELATNKLEGFHKEAAKDLEGRKQAIDELVKPIHESLGKVDEKIGVVEKERAGHYAALTKQLELVAGTQEQLRSETANLSQALRAPTVRGRWGEIQLRRVVELAGMVDRCDFREQPTISGEGRKLRPDLVVDLPGGASIVVDSKVPLEAYLEAAETTDPATRESRLGDHARHVREHMSQLSSKTYWKQFEDAPDFVVMFLPGEVFYSAALAHDPTLIEQGFQKRVLLASPTTLISILRAVHLGWNQERLAENARQISEAGRELYERVAGAGEKFKSLGKSLEAAVKNYNAAMGSLEARVLPSGRRMKELGAGKGDDLPELKPIESTVRALQSPELTSSAPTETPDVRDPEGSA